MSASNQVNSFSQINSFDAISNKYSRVIDFKNSNFFHPPHPPKNKQIKSTLTKEMTK